jgi:predicted transposase/invertase (TIGR01784 family)
VRAKIPGQQRGTAKREFRAKAPSSQRIVPNEEGFVVLQDFQNDKLSILDIRAVDQRGAIYDVEMQLSTHSGLVKRIVFYGCEVYAGQLKAGDDYSVLKPVYSICLLEGQLWDDSPKVHHAFRLETRDSGRLLGETLEIHTLELGWYNLQESELETACLLDRWL